MNSKKLKFKTSKTNFDSYNHQTSNKTMMNLRTILVLLFSTALTLSCVSKKKYASLETDYNNTRSELLKNKVENEDLQRQMEQIQMRVQRYNDKIATLNEDQNALKENMLVSTSDRSLVLSEKNKQAMRRILEKVPAYKLSQAKTLKDSLNLAISHNMMQSINGLETGKDLNVSIEESVVMINIDDNLLFNDSSYKIGSSADSILAKIAEVVNSEPSLEVLVEGHTDNRTVKKGSYVKDNWDLSTERSAAVVRRLQEIFGVDPDQLIVAGRSSYDPLVANNTNENRARNRRTKIIIMPNLDKFFALLGGTENTDITKSSD